MESSNAKRLISCKRCQQRKIRCSRTLPCINCATAKAKCEFREHDFKRPPVSREYVATLESRIATLEGLLVKVKAAPADERQAMLDHISFQDHLPAAAAAPSAAAGTAVRDDEAALREAMTKASLQETVEGSMIYHGPTSIFSDNEVAAAAESASHAGSPASLGHSTPRYADEYGSLHSNPQICLCVGLFFFWQYSQFMFIDREAFVQEFDQNPISGEFCSEPLVYAACAIGALMSPDPDIRATSSTFATSAQDILTSRELLGVPRVTSVQALLCCAYYEVGQGNLSKGWLFSGMAFRMGQDLGFQRDPAHWDLKSRLTIPYNFDNEFRRRIYWGSFLSDKIFSLFLGRPTFMHENDADVDISEPLPHDPPVWENWLHSHHLSFLKTMRPAGPKLTLLFNKQVELGRIIHDMLSHTFAPTRGKKGARLENWTEVSLNELNALLVSWHETLPSNMRWKKWFSASTDVLQPNVSVLHALYQSTRICLNLLFITSAKAPTSDASSAAAPSPRSAFSESLKICLSSAEAMVSILQRFRSQHTLGNAPIMFVHGAIVASNAILVTSRHSSGGHPPPLLKNTHFPALDAALLEMSASWPLAGQARTKFRSALSLRQQQLQLQQAAAAQLPGGSSSLLLPSGGPIVTGLEASTSTLASATGEPSSNASIPGADTAAVQGQDTDFSSGREEYAWDPVSMVDTGEAAFWADMDTDFLAGWEMEYEYPTADLDSGT